MKLYTKKGDAGETDLLLGGRVSKSDARTEAGGAIDTAVSAIGLARALCTTKHVKNILLESQHNLFTIGSELATEPTKYEMFAGRFPITTGETVEKLEKTIDKTDLKVKIPNKFIVPGASPGSSALDLARGLVREAERRVVALNEKSPLPNAKIMCYLNRLSDLLFILARLEDHGLPLDITTGELRSKPR